MGHRALIGTLAVLALAALASLFAVLTSHLAYSNLAYAQSSNSAPEFASDTVDRSVDEDIRPEGWYTDFGDPVTADDADNDPLTYSIEGAATSFFTIDSRTGQFQTGAPLDYEADSSYTVKVKATDPSGESDTVTVNISVNNLEEPGSASL